MYSGNQNSNTMLYGGPLGTYLSGIYQPTKPTNQSHPKDNRRNSLRNNSGINNSGSSASSLYYTPQPRRRQENTENRYNPSTAVGKSSYKDVSPSSIRPKSYYTPTIVNPVSGNYSRPSSVVLKNNIDLKVPTVTISAEEEDIDYKKLYEEEKAKNDKIRNSILDTEKQLDNNKIIIEMKTVNKLKDINLANEMDLKDLELLKGEGDKLRAENRALSRVVARLSREK